METTERPKKPITELTGPQRRVLGTLVEKAMTTPDQYPMTIKGLVSGCNQKSNRDPIVTYSEEEIENTLEDLRELGLAAVVHTEMGRTERFRHYLRHAFTLSEPQVAILTELLLRGRQQLGELRSRASRMVEIDSQEKLRLELSGLIEMKLVQVDGPLDRRGVEVDHHLYPSGERRSARQAFTPVTASEETHGSPPQKENNTQGSALRQENRGHSSPQQQENIANHSEWERRVGQLENQVRELSIELDRLKRLVEG